jgi:hypothetical protein
VIIPDIEVVGRDKVAKDILERERPLEGEGVRTKRVLCVSVDEVVIVGAFSWFTEYEADSDIPTGARISLRESGSRTSERRGEVVVTGSVFRTDS